MELIDRRGFTRRFLFGAAVAAAGLALCSESVCAMPLDDGAPGVDGETFEDIEKYGAQRYLSELADELIPCPTQTEPWPPLRTRGPGTSPSRSVSAISHPSNWRNCSFCRI